MAKKASTKDPWKTKRWYTMYAPESFNSVRIGTTPAAESKQLIGRVVEVSLAELVNDLRDMKKQRQKLLFKVNEVKGSDAFTEFRDFEITKDFERSLVRRGNSKIESVIDVKTNDDKKIRVKLLGLSNKKPQSTQEKTIRRIFKDTLQKLAADRDLTGFVQDVLFGGALHSIYKSSCKIYPMRHVTVGKCKVIG